MKRFRPRLTYANVVATLALFLALSGGVVWAANKITSKQIGKGAVKNKNLAKNAVKAKNLAKNAVTSAKLKKGAVTNAKVGNGAVNFAKLAAGTNVIASATAGPVSAKQDGPVDVPLNPPLTVTPVAGQLITVNIEARGTLVQSGAQQLLRDPLASRQRKSPADRRAVRAPGAGQPARTAIPQRHPPGRRLLPGGAHPARDASEHHACRCSAINRVHVRVDARPGCSRRNAGEVSCLS